MLCRPPKPDYEKVATEAKKLLDENYVVGPPVLVHEIAENCGLTVVLASFEDPGIAGTLDVENKRISVNQDDSLTRHAFTIAHELGHWILHVKSGDITTADKLYRKPLGKCDDNWMEKEANWFAANLLVPSEMLKLYDGFSQDEVARVFRVSPSVIGYRRMFRHG